MALDRLRDEGAVVTSSESWLYEVSLLAFHIVFFCFVFPLLHVVVALGREGRVKGFVIDYTIMDRL